jgi:hypothetical protein
MVLVYGDWPSQICRMNADQPCFIHPGPSRYKEKPFDPLIKRPFASYGNSIFRKLYQIPVSHQNLSALQMENACILMSKRVSRVLQYTPS